MRLVWQTLTALVLWLGFLGGSAIAQTPVVISISLTNYAFTPSALNLKAGTAYRLHFSNDGSKAHNFRAPDFFSASQIVPADKSKIDGGSVELDDGQSADITITPIQTGTFMFDCSHFMHGLLGMHGKITVQ